MMAFMMATLAADPGSWGPPAGLWFDNLFAYTALAAFVGMVIWDSLKSDDPSGPEG